MSATAAVVIALYVLGVGLNGSFFESFLIDVLMFGLAALGLQGMLAAGVLSLGQAAFFGLGGYGGVWALQHFGWSTVPALGFAMVVALAGAICMLPLLRLRNLYFVMASFAFGEALYEVFGQVVAVTGGANGIELIPNISLGGLQLTGTQGQYLFVLTIAVLVYAGYAALMRSGYGLTLEAVRQSEAGARAAGINVARMRAMAVCLGVMPAGLAGILYAQVHGFVAADLYNYNQSLALITMVVLGGVTSRWGSFVGAFIVLYLTTYTLSLQGYQLLIYGGVIAACMVVLPGGIAGGVKSARAIVAHRLARTSR